MAQVDFSNAVIEPVTSRFWGYAPNMTLASYTPLYDATSSAITSNETRSISYNSPSTKKYIYSGTFTASGTEFYISGKDFWRVSNISFSAGDTYSFEVEITVTGS